MKRYCLYIRWWVWEFDHSRPRTFRRENYHFELGTGRHFAGGNSDFPKCSVLECQNVIFSTVTLFWFHPMDCNCRVAIYCNYVFCNLVSIRFLEINLLNKFIRENGAIVTCLKISSLHWNCVSSSSIMTLNAFSTTSVVQIGVHSFKFLHYDY